MIKAGNSMTRNKEEGTSCGKRGEGEAGREEKTENTQAGRQASGIFCSASEYLATTPRMPLGSSHKSFLSSALEQFIRLRETSTTVQASHPVVPNNSVGQGFFF